MQILVRSNTGYNYWHPEQGKLISSEAVLLDKDAWLEAQVAAGILDVVEQAKSVKGPKAE